MVAWKDIELVAKLATCGADKKAALKVSFAVENSAGMLDFLWV